MYKFPTDKKSIEYELQHPFEPHEIEWRVQNSGGSSNKPWCIVVPYVDARAIQVRLDQIFGFSGWKQKFEFITTGSNETITPKSIQNTYGIICHLSVLVDEKKNLWIEKSDGSQETDIESFKGGLSSATKRVAASGFGMGRYLYYLDVTFAECQTDRPNNMKGWHNQKSREGSFHWRTPDLPNWALPESTTTKSKPPISSKKSNEVFEYTFKGGELKDKNLSEITDHKLLDKVLGDFGASMTPDLKKNIEDRSEFLRKLSK